MALRYKIKVMQKYKQGNEEKTRYIDIGAVLDGRNGGFILKLESVPVGWDGWAYLTEPETHGSGQRRGAPPARTNAAPSGPAGEDEDIPF